ncbi:MAG: LysR family transcriptional regulator [Woeseiaceae bacterium]|nr:LysR family transcriptional regulator [Woeseiaceae bacterium]
MRIRMDWRGINFDWNRARAFLVTAEEGSLSAAARALGMTQPTLGRQVTALEDELGVALFERGGRGLELTPSGLDLVEHVRAMGEAAGRLSLSASGQSSTLEGNVCISATEAMATFGLPSLIAELRRAEPGIEIELIASNSASDLKRREADIAIRAFRPTQPDLIGKRLADSTARLYAAPGYLETLGETITIEAIQKAEFLGISRGNQMIEALSERGIKVTQANFPVITENHIVHWELTRAGVGIGVMPEEVGDAEPDVVRVLDTSFDIELWLVAHRELRTSRRVRRVFDFLAEKLS